MLHKSPRKGSVKFFPSLCAASLSLSLSLSLRPPSLQRDKAKGTRLFFAPGRERGRAALGFQRRKRRERELNWTERGRPLSSSLSLSLSSFLAARDLRGNSPFYHFNKLWRILDGLSAKRRRPDDGSGRRRRRRHRAFFDRCCRWSVVVGASPSSCCLFCSSPQEAQRAARASPARPVGRRGAGNARHRAVEASTLEALGAGAVRKFSSSLFLSFDESERAMHAGAKTEQALSSFLSSFFLLLSSHLFFLSFPPLPRSLPLPPSTATPAPRRSSRRRRFATWPSGCGFSPTLD